VSIGYIETPPEFTTGTLNGAIMAATRAVLTATRCCSDQANCGVCQEALASLLRRLCIARGAR
jgi:hypothetical protein